MYFRTKMDTYDKRRLLSRLKSKEYRESFSADVGTGLAFQIKLLREKAGWTQEQLAQRLDKPLLQISQWENPNYGGGRYSLATLHQLAAAFDIALVVKFAPFSELVDWIENLTPERLAPPSYHIDIQRGNWMLQSDPLPYSDVISVEFDVHPSNPNFVDFALVNYLSGEYMSRIDLPLSELDSTIYNGFLKWGNKEDVQWVILNSGKKKEHLHLLDETGIKIRGVINVSTLPSVPESLNSVVANYGWKHCKILDQALENCRVFANYTVNPPLWLRPI